MTIRRTMIAVAVLAVVFWAGLVASRWVVYRRRTLQLGELSLVLRLEGAIFETQLQSIPAENPAARKGLEASIAERRQARIKTEILLDRYRAAARRPWIRVEPDSTVEDRHYP